MSCCEKINSSFVLDNPHRDSTHIKRKSVSYNLCNHNRQRSCHNNLVNYKNISQSTNNVLPGKCQCFEEETWNLNVPPIPNDEWTRNFIELRRKWSDHGRQKNCKCCNCRPVKKAALCKPCLFLPFHSSVPILPSVSVCDKQYIRPISKVSNITSNIQDTCISQSQQQLLDTYQEHAISKRRNYSSQTPQLCLCQPAPRRCNCPPPVQVSARAVRDCSCECLLLPECPCAPNERRFSKHYVNCPNAQLCDVTARLKRGSKSSSLKRHYSERECVDTDHSKTIEPQTVDSSKDNEEAELNDNSYQSTPPIVNEELHLNRALCYRNSESGPNKILTQEEPSNKISRSCSILQIPAIANQSIPFDNTICGEDNKETNEVFQNSHGNKKISYAEGDQIYHEEKFVKELIDTGGLIDHINKEERNSSQHTEQEVATVEIKHNTNVLNNENKSSFLDPCIDQLVSINFVDDKNLLNECHNMTFATSSNDMKSFNMPDASNKERKDNRQIFYSLGAICRSFFIPGFLDFISFVLIITAALIWICAFTYNNPNIFYNDYKSIITALYKRVRRC